MNNCLERCNDFARSKSARVIYGVVFTLVCIAMIYRLYDASNRMQERNQIMDARSQSNLRLLFDEDGALIHFTGNFENSNDWKNKYEEFLAPYKSPHPNRVRCDYNNPPPPGKACDVDLDAFGSCSPSNNFGISDGTVCVFLKLRNNSSWTPLFYNASEPPSNIPQQLRNHIDFDMGDKKQKMAWTTCSGKDPVDVEKIGPITYIPDKGFHDYQFAAIADQSLDPILAIYFERPEKKIVISVECKLWTRNSDDKVSFQLLLD